MTADPWLLWNGALAIACSLYLLADIAARIAGELASRDDLNQDARDE